MGFFTITQQMRRNKCFYMCEKKLCFYANKLSFFYRFLRFKAQASESKRVGSFLKYECVSTF